MSWWRDVVDWVGGYPFEVASVRSVVERLEAAGYEIAKVISVGRNSGNNQYLATKPH
jgi:hypothetical protein